MLTDSRHLDAQERIDARKERQLSEQERTLAKKERDAGAESRKEISRLLGEHQEIIRLFERERMGTYSAIQEIPFQALLAIILARADL